MNLTISNYHSLFLLCVGLQQLLRGISDSLVTNSPKYVLELAANFVCQPLDAGQIAYICFIRAVYFLLYLETVIDVGCKFSVDSSILATFHTSHMAI